jgi:DnaJ-class molecular chaperone
VPGDIIIVIEERPHPLFKRKVCMIHHSAAV